MASSLGFSELVPGLGFGASPKPSETLKPRDLASWDSKRPMLKPLGLGSVLPPLSNTWIVFLIWLYIALRRTPNIDCYWEGALPKV